MLLALTGFKARCCCPSPWLILTITGPPQERVTWQTRGQGGHRGGGCSACSPAQPVTHTAPAQTGSVTPTNGSLALWGVIPVTVYSSSRTHTLADLITIPKATKKSLPCQTWEHANVSTLGEQNLPNHASKDI